MAFHYQDKLEDSFLGDNKPTCPLTGITLLSLHNFLEPSAEQLIIIS